MVSRWIISTNHGDAIRARFVAMANGTYRSRNCLVLRYYRIPRACVSHQPVDYDYTGSLPCCQTRGGIIGTGAPLSSACHLARSVEHLLSSSALRRPSMCVATDRPIRLVGSPRRWLAAPPYREFQLLTHRGEATRTWSTTHGPAL